MEMMDLTLSIIQDLSHVIHHHPLYSLVGSIFLFGCLLRLYCKLTMGMCDSDQDMTGKTVMITGASAGIGKATALDLARRNARVLFACRNEVKGNRVAREIKSATGNQNVVVKYLDLSSFESVRQCAKSVLETEDKLHVLINNAGIRDTSEQLTKDGCEIIMQSNHLGHFLLTLLLLDLMRRSSPSRIINVSSDQHANSKFDVEDFKNERKLSSFYLYGNSKLSNVLFTRELAERLQDTGVTVNCLHPGCVKTDILKNMKTSFFTLMVEIIFFIVGKSPEEGAQTTILLAVDPSLEKTTGKYFVDCKESPVAKEAENRTTTKRLFEASQKIVGVSF